MNAGQDRLPSGREPFRPAWALAGVGLLVVCLLLRSWPSLTRPGLFVEDAVELVADKATKAKFDPVGKAGAIYTRKSAENGLINRAIGDTICFCPPLIITEAQVDEIMEKLDRALDGFAAAHAGLLP